MDSFELNSFGLLLEAVAPLVTQPFLVAVLLIVWFKTNAFIEYAEVLGLGGLFSLSLFKEKRKNHPNGLTYLNYLLIYQSSFIIRLITCPICLCIWLNVIYCAIVYWLFNFNFWYIGLHIYLSLVLYYKILILLEKIDGKNSS